MSLKARFAAAIAATAVMGFASTALAQSCSQTTYPYPLQNGSTADAVQVMANFNCAAPRINPAFTGPVVIGAPYHGDASLHITSSYGGFGRLTQIAPYGPNAAAYNLMGSNDGSGNTYWWTWGISNNTWMMTPGFNFTSNPAFSVNSNGVGIGTISAGDALSVTGNADFGAARYSYVGPSQYGGLTFPRGQILFSNSNGQNQLYMVSNGYEGPSGLLAYRNASPAVALGLDNGKISFLTAGSGAADAAIPWTAAMTVDTSGKVGIGTATPAAMLSVQGPGVCNSGLRTAWAGDGGNAFDVVQGQDNNLYFCYAGGGVARINTDGSYNQLSDARLKTNIGALASASGLTAISKLRPVAYSFKSDKTGSKHLGFIAQEVQKIFPDLVSAMALPVVGGNEGDQIADAKSIDYAGMVAPLVKAVQELKVLNDKQAAEIKALKVQVAALKVAR